MVLVNSLYVLPRHSNKHGIVIYDNLQGQEIMKLNKKDFNTIFNIVDTARNYGFIYTSTEADSIKKWYLNTRDNNYKSILHYNRLFSTTYYLSDLAHYWLCPHCLSAVPDTWDSCTICNNQSFN